MKEYNYEDGPYKLLWELLYRSNMYTSSYKWSWAIPELVSNLKSVVHEANELKVLVGTEEEVMNEILEPWRNTDMRKFLQKKFPLLNVPNLDRQIAEAVA